MGWILSLGGVSAVDGLRSTREVWAGLWNPTELQMLFFIYSVLSFYNEVQEKIYLKLNNYLHIIQF